MLFNSYPFALGFLPLLMLGYLALSESRWQGLTPWLLVGASLFFYAWWNWLFLPLFLSSIVFNYCCARLILRAGHTTRTTPAVSPRWLFALGIVANVLLLGYFKYRDFFVGSVDLALGARLPLLHMALPLAISFFTFEQITYLDSAYHGQTGVDDLVSYLLFITFFPHLIAGPIVQFRDIYPQLNRRSRFGLEPANLNVGLMIFAIGLFKKVILADTFRSYVDPTFDAHWTLGFGAAWGGALAFALQVYFDFSGYSDMAIGLARMFNVRFPENFDSPYQTTNAIDFWRRWHITLSMFLRDYVYIPLGGNRCGPRRQNLNLFLTLLIGGLWHGANWTFVAFGALQGLYVSLNHWWRRRGLPMGVLMGWGLTFAAIVASFVFFRANSFSRAWDVLSGMAGLHGFGSIGSHYEFGLKQYKRIVPGLLLVWLAPNRQTLMKWETVADPIYVGAFTLMLLSSLLNMANPPPFVYFQF